MEGLASGFIFIIVLLFIVVIILAVGYFIYVEHNTQITSNKDDVSAVKKLISTMEKSIQDNKTTSASTVKMADIEKDYLKSKAYDDYKVLHDKKDMKKAVEELNKSFKVTGTDDNFMLEHCKPIYDEKTGVYSYKDCKQILLAKDVQAEDINKYGVIVDFIPIYGDKENLSLLTIKPPGV